MTWIVRLAPSTPTNLTPCPANLAAFSWSSSRYTSVFESVFDNSTYCPPRFLTQKVVHLMALSPIDFDSLISWCEWVWEWTLRAHGPSEISPTKVCCVPIGPAPVTNHVSTTE